MKKTVIALALVLVLICILLTACKSKKDDGETTTAPVGESTTVEVFTDPATGETYVTNKDGEHIPVTTSLDGSMEFYDDLVTKTGEQVSKEAASIEEAKQTQTAPAPTSAPTTQPSQGTTQSSDSVEIGDGDVFDDGHAAVIDWG